MSIYPYTLFFFFIIFNTVSSQTDTIGIPFNNEITKEDTYVIKGKIVDEKKTELPFVNVYIEGTTVGTTSNTDGEFMISVKSTNPLVLVFQTLGYVKRKLKINFNAPTDNYLIVLKSENYLIQEVVVRRDKKDPAYAIMREAIKQRNRNNEKVNSFSANVYMKSTVKMLDVPKKLPFFINKKSLPDSTNLGIVFMSESVAKYSMQKPNDKKEEMMASKVAGQKTGFSWNRVEDVFVNFYEPSIKIFNYSERPFVSPLATGSLLNYKYTYLGTFYIDNKPIHKIEIIPRRKGDPLFHGQIYINEGDNYQIYSSDLYMTSDAQIEFADTVHIKQEMIKVNDSIWMPVQLQIYSHIKFFGFTATDLSTASISNYVVNKSFPKKYFNNEVFKIEDKANKKDSLFWTTTRPAILSTEEMKYYAKGDSLLKRMETKSYKDSVSKANNQWNIGLDGIRKKNDFTGSTFRTNSFFNMISYNTVEGISIRTTASFYKRNKETRVAKGLTAKVQYGFDNYKWSGAASAFWFFNPKKNQNISLTGSRSLTQFNEFDPIGTLFNTAYTLLDKSNYMKLYQKDMVRVNYNHELINGLTSNIDLQYIAREALLNSSFYYLYGDDNKHFTSNNPIVDEGAYSDTKFFKPEQLIQFKANFKFIPFAKYETYPTYKRMLNTKWPEFSMAYKKGKSIQSSAFNYDYLELGVGKDIELRSLGLFKFDVVGGAFFNTKGMNFTDYKHFNGNQTFFLMNKPSSDLSFYSTRDQISEFHNLNYYTLSTNTRFIEYHASHNFRGFFIGKIPLLRKTKFYEIAGINGVVTKSGSYHEVYVGIDKIVKVFRFDIGTAINENKKIDLFYRFGLRLSLF